MSDPVAEIHYSGEVHVRPYRRGTYVGDELLEAVVERALGRRYSFGEGWSGLAEITIVFRDAPAEAPEQPPSENAA